MLYELRIYHMHPGKWEAINDRFKDHTLSIFGRLGLKLVDFWESIEDEPKLYYVLEFDSLEDRENKWEAFRNDPEWIEARTKSEENGKIVEKVDVVYLKRPEYFRK